MVDSDTPVVEDASEFHLAPAPKAWKPERIVYAMISCRMTDRGLELYYKKQLEDDRTDIDRFVDDILFRRFRFGRFLRNVRHKVPLGPLDLRITRPSYVVLELDRRLNWHFRPGKPAVTMKRPGLKQYNGLRHVSQTGDHWRRPLRNCNIVFFNVQDTSGPDNDFNLNVRLKQYSPSGQLTPLDIVIDPDIPNTGGPG